MSRVQRWEMGEAVEVLRRDPDLRSLIKKVGPIELKSHRPYFWLLCVAILSQQVSTAAANSIIGKVRALYPGRRYPDAKSILSTSEKKLQACGVSRQKRRYLYAIAEAFTDGGLGKVKWSRLSDEEILERLTAIVGIGVWTAEMFLMFSMRRPDVFPVDDLGIRKGMERFLRISDVGEMVERAERWRPFRTVGSLYLWHGLGAE